MVLIVMLSIVAPHIPFTSSGQYHSPPRSGIAYQSKFSWVTCKLGTSISGRKVKKNLTMHRDVLSYRRCALQLLNFFTEFRLFFFLFFCLPTYLSVCLSVYLYCIYSFIHSFIYYLLSIYLFIYLFIYFLVYRLI